jgi:transcriptional regulator with XRE-family HTH domain
MARTGTPDARLAALLRDLRTSQGRSQETLAYEARLTHASLGRIERAESDPGWSSVVKIADALGVSFEELGRQFDERRKSSL